MIDVKSCKEVATEGRNYESEFYGKAHSGVETRRNEELI